MKKRERTGRGAQRNEREKSISSRDILAREQSVDLVRNRAGDLRVNLVYPNTYWVAMSNLGYQAVYALFGKEESTLVERGFLPDEVLKGEKPLRGYATLESNRPLYECDVLGFSLSFETDYPHLITILGESGLLFRDAQAREHQRANADYPAPLLIAGGTSVTLNPEPVADLLDVIVLGEAEELIPEFTAVVRNAKREGISMDEVLYQLSHIEGVYVPKFHTPHYNKDGSIASFSRDPRASHRPQRRFVQDLSRFPTYTKILTPDTEFKSMFLTETGRGCEMGCRFCVAGYIYRPVRKRSEESIAATIDIGLQKSDAIGFVGASVSSHKSIARLAKSVADRGARASLSSIMSQKVTHDLAASISESEYKTVALAPEAGTERLRRAAGKRVSNEQVIEAARELALSGIRGFKLYFIVGLPTEEDRDTDAIAELSLKVRDAVREATKSLPGKSPWVQLSVNPFIPKAATPFQWEPMITRDLLDKKIERIRSLIRREPHIELRFESPKESVFQALLSRGDRRVVEYLLSAYEKKRDWNWILQDKHEDIGAKVPPVSFYVERRIDFQEILPWDIVDCRIDKKLLEREALRAYHGEQYKRGESTVDDPTLETSEDLAQGAVFG